MATKYWISTSSTSFNTAANWSDTAAPANGDTLVFNGVGTANVETNLGTILTTVTVIVESGYTGNIGLVSGAAATYLVLDGGTLKMPAAVGGSSSSGSPRVMLDFGTTAATVLIETSNATGAETYYPPVQIKGTVITATITGGNVGFAVRQTESATLVALNTAKGASEPSVYLGQGVTLTAAVLEAGNIESRVANTAVTTRISGAKLNVSTMASGAHTTIHLDAGSLTYSGSGTITTLNVKGIADFSKDNRSKTVTTCTTYKGSTLNVDNGQPGAIIFSNAVNHADGIGGQGCNFITPAFVKGTLITQ